MTRWLVVVALAGCPAKQSKTPPGPSCCCEYQQWSPTTSYEVLSESYCEQIGRCVVDSACTGLSDMRVQP